MEKNKPIYVVIGTRAQLIKMAPIMQELEKQKIPYNFLYTQQHKVTIDSLLNNFNIKTPYINVINHNTEAKTKKILFGWLFKLILILLNPWSRKNLFPQGRGLVITHGDTLTTVWSAIYGKTSGCEVMHIESGLRSFNIFQPFPEEIQRLITFALSNYFVCPNQLAMNNLKHFPGKKLNTEINTMYDSLQFALQKIKSKDYKSTIRKLDLPKQFALVSIHRYQNIFSKKQLSTIVTYLIKISNSINLIITLHPSTEKQLVKYGYFQQLRDNSNITLIPRQDFLSFIELSSKTEFIITDGGSNQEEMSYIGKPTILFRNRTERNEGLGENVILSKFNEKVIMNFINNYKKYKRPSLEINHSPSKKIVEFIKSVIESK